LGDENMKPLDQRISKILSNFTEELSSYGEKAYCMLVNKNKFLIEDFGYIKGLKRNLILDNPSFEKSFNISTSKGNTASDITVNTNNYNQVINYLCADLYLITIIDSSSSSSKAIKTIAYTLIEMIKQERDFDIKIEKLKKKTEYEKKITEEMEIGYLALDTDGRITNANQKAIDLTNETEPLIGKLLREITEFEPDIFSVINTGKGWKNKEFIIDLRYKKNLHLIKNCIPLYDNDNNIVGALDIMREIKTVKKIINKMNGSISKFSQENLIIESDSMKEIMSFAKSMAKYNSTILIEGESGTGKELIAKAIHAASPRKNEAFITIDCTSLPYNLVESELFGYVEGAFTGARKGGRPGKFEMADGGTVFLDEIGELPLDAQKKLLRVLQSKTITRVGDFESLPIDIRVIAATNRNLLDEIADKNFRKDLYYRINVISIKVPSLKERNEDILPIAKYFISEIGNNIGKNYLYMSNDYSNALMNYSWPGNVRQLKNCIERGVNICEKEELICSYLPNIIISDLENINTENNKNFTPLDYSEKEIIEHLLTVNNWNKSIVAGNLNISRTTLYSKLKKYNITNNNI
jgi:transcriptional regulator with PAS, ATPase and Fis domain